MAVTIVIAAVLALVSATALLVATNVLHDTTAEVSASVESVRFAEEAEINLLLFARTQQPLLRRKLESELLSSLDAAQQYVTTDEESQILVRARESVAEYRRLSEATGTAAPAIARAEELAFAALVRLVDINVEQTRDAYASAVAWDRTANVLGVVLGVSIIAITTALMLWLRRRVLRPLFGLADTVRRFGRGERTVRAAVAGPQEICEMSERFNEMADSLGSQRDAQIAFLAGVAHDLRTPLSALRMACDLIDPGAPLPPEPQLRHLVSMIGRQIDRLERMTGDFLDLSKIEAGRLELAIEARDLRSIARNVVELFDNARSRIDLSVAPSPIVVPCDEVRIAQVITNLVSNALKYSPESEPIHVLVSSVGRDAIVEVVDHGAGIPREDHGRIFEPFRRRRSDRPIPGTGLGLFNVKHLVEAHGGRIQVDSAPSRGSTFRIHLPLA